MEYLVIGYDYPDALERRLACREEHMALIAGLKSKGHFLHGGAILNEAGDMAGSVLVCNFASREAMDEIWLSREPYILNKVWDRVEIHPHRTAPAFIQPALSSPAAAE